MWSIKKHQCQWKEVNRVFIGPRVVKMGSTELSGRESIVEYYDWMDRVTFGITSVELKCTECGDVQETVLLGNHIKSPTAR